MAADEDPEGKRGSQLPWIVYRQVMAAIGALSLLVLVGHFVDLGLKGVIGEAVQWWVDNVRPAVGDILRFLGLKFDVPDLAKDYLAVGAVWGTSSVRSGLSPWRGQSSLFANIQQALDVVVEFAFYVVGWPIWAPTMLYIQWTEYFRGVRDGLESITDQSAETKKHRLRSLRWKRIQLFLVFLSPIVYLGLILALNMVL